MIEAELKAHLENPEEVVRHLDALAQGRAEVYEDTYYDDADGGLAARDHELRVRVVHGPGETRSVLTYKGAKMDAESETKPEYETRVEDPLAMAAILRGLGYEPAISFEKRCWNYDFEAHGRHMAATLAQVPELDGTFLELEVLIEDSGDFRAAIADVRSVMHGFGIRDTELTRERYTHAVAAQREKEQLGEG